MDNEKNKADIELGPESPSASPFQHQDHHEEDPRAVRSLVWKQDIRIIPLAVWTYFLCSLDRGNIGNARILNHSDGNDLLTETNMTQYQFIIALMIFLIAYGLFEVPSNILLKKYRPSRWIAFLMFSWGAVTIGLGGVQAFWSVTFVRFLLGVFEAGLFPGLVYYITFWYRTEERSIRVALILASATLAGAFGGAIAYGIGHMNQVGGHSGWRWLFILEGIPSCLSAILIWFCLPDYPDTASWLSPEEKALAARRLAVDGSKSDAPSMTKADAVWVLKQPRLYVHYIVYFGISVPFSSLSLFTPSITSGLGYYDLQAQLMSVPPYAVAYVVQVLTSWSADYFNARALHSATLATVGAAGFIGSALLPPESYSQRYGCLIVAASGSFACIPPLLGWISSNVFSGPAIGMAIALNIGLGGAPGQIAGVWIYKTNEALEGYPTGHWTNAALLLMVAVGCMILRFWYIQLNKRRQGSELDAGRVYVY